MKYKVGDKVRVRSDLAVGEAYDGWYYDSNMSVKKGVLLTILEINPWNYYVMDDGSEYWTDGMLEDIEPEFVLPEKWCVKCVRQDEVDIVEKYLYGKVLPNPYIPKYLTNKGLGDMPGHNPTYFKEWRCNEITFDQFKKYVLKETESESKPKEEIPKFIIGRWYKNPKWWSSAEDFCKFSGEFDADLIGYTEKIIKGNFYSKEAGLWRAEGCIEASIEEYSKYLPDGHPDKIKPEAQSIESLLEEAKRRYPVGTKFKSPENGKIYEVNIRHRTWEGFNKRNILISIGNNWGEFVFHNGKWAEIVEETQKEEIPEYVECIGLKERDVICWRDNYEIGGIYKLNRISDGGNYKIVGKSGERCCDKSQFKPSTKEAFDKQEQRSKQLERPISQKEEELVQTDMCQEDSDSDEIYVPIIKTEVKQIKL